MDNQTVYFYFLSSDRFELIFPVTCRNIFFPATKDGRDASGYMLPEADKRYLGHILYELESAFCNLDIASY